MIGVGAGRVVGAVRVGCIGRADWAGDGPGGWVGLGG